jgi:PilZ domain.
MFPTGSEIEVHCRLREEWVKARGIVRRSRESGLGVEFIALEDRDRELIREYVLFLESQSVTSTAKPAMAAH